MSYTPDTITVVMITADRTARGKSRNYLADTIANAERAGIFRSKYLNQFILFPTDSRMDDAWLRYCRQLLSQYDYSKGGSKRSFAIPPWGYEFSPCQNAGNALIQGGQHGREWVLFMEDDLDFCANFLESVALWLSDNATDSERVYSFGCAYSALMEQAYSCKLCAGKPDSWCHFPDAEGLHYHPFEQSTYKLTYPGLNTFYGTQCFAVRSSDAISLGQYMYSNPIFPDGLHHPNSYDLMISQWVEREYGRDSNVYAARAIVASVPSFVQHIGEESICTDIDIGKVHTFSTWQGKEWEYK